MFTKGLVKCHATLKLYSTIKTAIWTEYKTVLLLLCRFVLCYKKSMKQIPNTFLTHCTHVDFILTKSVPTAKMFFSLIYVYKVQALCTFLRINSVFGDFMIRMQLKDPNGILKVDERVS